jgi:hypothetical protein
MRRLSVKAASDRLALEDALEAVERRASANGNGAEAPSLIAARQLVDGWDGMKFAARQSALREAVERIIVTDDNVAVELR